MQIYYSTNHLLSTSMQSCQQVDSISNRSPPPTCGKLSPCVNFGVYPPIYSPPQPPPKLPRPLSSSAYKGKRIAAACFRRVSYSCAACLLAAAVCLAVALASLAPAANWGSAMCLIARRCLVALEYPATTPSQLTIN